MIGWFGDFFRFWWALFYWNTRKTWFRLRGAHRDSCPCQNFSDSGLALDSRCEAVTHWHQPKRFRRVCPLLTQTADGHWRCGVDAERVRPFWWRALAYGALAAIGLYGSATGAAYLALRAAGYELGYATVAWPGHWREIRQAQEKLYAERAQQAMNSGNYRAAILALERVCQLNPLNYEAGLALANLAQVASHPTVSDLTYERLLRDLPDQRVTTSRLWFRALLARGAYDKLKPLAAAMLVEDVSERGVWLNALLFAARATNDSEILTAILNQRHAQPEWCNELIEIERDLLTGHEAEARPLLLRIARQPEVLYQPYFQVDRLIRAGWTDEALAVLDAYRSTLPADEISLLRLRIFQARGWTHALAPECATLLHPRLTARSAAQLCALFLQAPSLKLCQLYGARFAQDFPMPTGESLPLFHATYLAAIACGDAQLAGQTLDQIRHFTRSDARVIIGLGELLAQRGPNPRLPRILPLVPLPIEVIYALREGQQPAPARP